MLRAAAASHQWLRIHEAHYDWWMFPIDEPSRFGDAYAVMADGVSMSYRDRDCGGFFRQHS